MCNSIQYNGVQLFLLKIQQNIGVTLNIMHGFLYNALQKYLNALNMPCNAPYNAFYDLMTNCNPQ